MTSAAWLVISMNGGGDFTRASIKPSRPLTSPPRIGGGCSQSITGCFAVCRGCGAFFSRGGGVEGGGGGGGRGGGGEGGGGGGGRRGRGGGGVGGGGFLCG